MAAVALAVADATDAADAADAAAAVAGRRLGAVAVADAAKVGLLHAPVATDTVDRQKLGKTRYTR